MRHPIRSLLVTLFFISISFITKAQQPTTALELNDAMADITDSLYQAGSEWGKAFGDAYKTGRYDLIKPYRVRLENFINQKLEYVVTMKDINNSKSLRLAVIEFLSYEKRLLQEAFLPFERLKSSVTKEEVQKLIDNLTTLAAKEKDMLAKVSEAQELYGAENGFAIENKL